MLLLQEFKTVWLVMTTHWTSLLLSGLWKLNVICFSIDWNIIATPSDLRWAWWSSWSPSRWSWTSARTWRRRRRPSWKPWGLWRPPPAQGARNFLNILNNSWVLIISRSLSQEPRISWTNCRAGQPSVLSLWEVREVAKCEGGGGGRAWRFPKK